MRTAGGIKSDNCTILVNDLKAATDMDSSGKLDLSLFKDRQLGCPTSDVDIKDTLVSIPR